VRASAIGQAGYFGVAKAVNMALSISVAVLAARNEAQGEAALFLFFQPLLFLLASLAPLGVGLELMGRVPQAQPADRPAITWALLLEGMVYVALASLLTGGVLGGMALAQGNPDPWQLVVPVWLFWQGTSMLAGEALRANGEVVLAALSQGTVAQGVVFGFMVWETWVGAPLSFLALAVVSASAQLLGTLSSVLRLPRFVGRPTRIWVVEGLSRGGSGWRRPAAKLGGRTSRLAATAIVGLAQQVDTVLARLALSPVPFNDFVVASRLGNLVLIPRMLVLRAFGPQLSSGAGHEVERVRSRNRRIGWSQALLGAAVVSAFAVAGLLVPPVRKVLGEATDLRLVAVVLAGRLLGVAFGVPDFLLSMRGRFGEVSLVVGGAYLLFFGGALVFLGLAGDRADAGLWVAGSLGLAFATSRWWLNRRLSSRG